MSIPERPTRILAVDDEEQIRRALKSILGRGATCSRWRRPPKRRS